MQRQIENAATIELEKVIRIVAIFMVVLAIAIRTATILLFDKPWGSSIPLFIALLICGGIALRDTTKNKTQNK